MVINKKERKKEEILVIKGQGYGWSKLKIYMGNMWYVLSLDCNFSNQLEFYVPLSMFCSKIWNNGKWNSNGLKNFKSLQKMNITIHVGRNELHGGNEQQPKTSKFKLYVYLK